MTNTTVLAAGIPMNELRGDQPVRFNPLVVLSKLVEHLDHLFQCLEAPVRIEDLIVRTKVKFCLLSLRLQTILPNLPPSGRPA